MNPRIKEREKKYCVHSGFVISKNDGQEHKISAFQIIELYKVTPKECFFYDEQVGHRGMALDDSVTCLYPRYDGNYSIPKTTNTERG